LERLSTRRIYKVVNGQVLIMLVFYLLMALAGYFSTLTHTPRIVLERKSLTGDGIDTSILVGIVLLVILLLIHSPVNYFPSRLIIAQWMGKEEVTKKMNYGITLGFFSLVVTTAIFFPDITAVLSIIGGLCAVTQGYVLPTAMSIKISGKPMSDPYNLATLAIGGVIGFLGYSTVIMTILA